MWFGLLGVLTVQSDDGRELDIGPPQRRELLAFLLSHANRPVSMDRIVDALWPNGSRPPGAAVSIQSHISRLRKTLGWDRIVTRSPGYLVRVSPEALDILDFFQSVRDGSKLAHQGSDHAAFEELSRALNLWRGEPLVEFAYSDWAQTEISHLHAVRTGAVRERFSVGLAMGLHRVVLPELETEASANPGDEELARALATALYRCGRQREALEQLAMLRRYLAEAVGIAPTPETDQLELAIFDHDPLLLGHRPAARPQRSGLSDVAGISKTSGTWLGNIREPLSEFVGRAFSIAELTAAIDADRLVTITGAGGSGKTRLAIQVALGVAPRFADGAWLIDLDEAQDPDGLVPAIKRSLGLVEDFGGDSIGALVEAIERREVLLVLDNCEHVVDAVAQLSEEILEGCPNVRILTTSREPLALPVERLWRIPTLDLPHQEVTSIEELLTYESVALFVLRAKKVDQSFQVSPSNVAGVAQVCRSLDGLPLAIEMAAGQLAYRSLTELTEDIARITGTLSSPYRRVPARHRTLTAAIDWSMHDLDHPDLEFLRRLSVFEASFDRGTAIALARSDPTSAEHILHRLVDRSLVKKTTDVRSRYRILVPIRDHLRSHLDDEILEATRRDVAEHLADRAGSAQGGLFGEDAMRWFWWCQDSRLVVENNLQWCIGASPDLGATILSGLFWYLSDANPWLGPATQLVETITDASLRSCVDAAIAMLAIQMMRNDLAVSHARRALSGDAPAAARLAAHCALTWSRLLTEHPDGNLADHLDSIQDMGRLSTMPFHDALIEHLIGLAHVIVGKDAAKAIPHLDASVETAKKHDFRWLLGFMMNNHAETLYQAGSGEQAAAELDEAAVHCQELKMWPDLASVLTSRAYWQIRQANPNTALTSALEAANVAFRHGIDAQLAIALEVLTMCLVDDDRELARAAHAWAHRTRARSESVFDAQIWNEHSILERVLGGIDLDRNRLENTDGLSGLLARVEDLVHPSMTSSH